MQSSLTVAGRQAPVRWLFMAGDHYFSENPTSEQRPRRISITLAGRTVEVNTMAGTFSPERLDVGTSALLANTPVPPSDGHLLDVGCGWGPIALSLAMHSPEATVWAIDVNERSLELTRRNAEELGLTNVRAVKPDEVPEDIMFRTIWSNPPIRVGKDELHSLLRRWIPRMEEHSDAWLVVARQLGADSLQRWLAAEFPHDHSVQRTATHKGFRVLRMRKHGTPRTDVITLP